MKEMTFARETIRKRIKEKMELATCFQDYQEDYQEEYQEYYGFDYNDCHSDYFDSNA